MRFLTQGPKSALSAAWIDICDVVADDHLSIVFVQLWNSCRV